MKCMCAAEPVPVCDEHTGETVCGACGTVLEERAARAVWEGAPMESGRGAHTSRRVTRYVTTQRMADGSAHASRDALLRKLAPILEHVSATGAITDEATTLARRMCTDGFAKNRPRMNLCAGVVLAACRIHGRIIRREEVAEMTGTDSRKISRIARVITARYGLKPLPVEERTRRILSRMCDDVGEPALLRPALRTYESMLLTGHTAGKSPYVVAAKALRHHAVRIMPDARFAAAVGVPCNHMNRYSEMMQNASEACSSPAPEDAAV